MIYVTSEQLTEFVAEAVLVQLTDETGAGVVDADKVAIALRYADATISGYVAAQYQLPLPATPELLTSIGLDLAHWRLYRQAPLDHVQKAHDAAIARLRDISAGRLKLDLPANTPATPTSPLIRAGQAASSFDWGAYG